MKAMIKCCLKHKNILLRNLTRFFSCILLYLLKIKRKFSCPSLKEQENSLSPQISLKLPLPFQTSDMLSIVDRKSIDILIKYGNGKKDGVVRLWLSKDLVEPVERLMVIAIGFILQLYMQTSWSSFRPLKS